MTATLRAFVGVLCVIGVPIVASAAESGRVGGGEFFIVGPNAISVPEGYFVLVRRGEQIGAFRLTKVFNTGELGLGTSHYDSYFQGDGSGQLLAPNAVRRQGDIDIRPLKGVHAFAWQPGQNHLRVGKWTFNCFTNQLVNMSLGFSEEDTGFEFAPTSVRDLAGLDAHKSSLKWYRFDRNTTLTVPVKELEVPQGG
jgi:hypothetical protein